MTASRPPSLAQAARHWQCGYGNLPSRSADTTHDADTLPDYPGRPGHPDGGYRYHIGDQPGQGVGMGPVTSQGWRLNRSADMFVLLSWEQSTQHLRHPRRTAI